MLNADKQEVKTGSTSNQTSSDGMWNYNRKLWEIRYEEVVIIDLIDRITQEKDSDNGKTT